MDPFFMGLLLGGGAALVATIVKWWLHGIKLDSSSLLYKSAGIGVVFGVIFSVLTKQDSVGWASAGVFFGYVTVMLTDHFLTLALRQRRRRIRS